MELSSFPGARTSGLLGDVAESPHVEPQTISQGFATQRKPQGVRGLQESALNIIFIFQFHIHLKMSTVSV
jgi:hypothetical protein